jgi:predicted nucleic acid-binding protein
LGVGGLRSFLRSRSSVALDASVFIYQLDVNPTYFPLTDAVFAWLEKRENSAVTSTLSMTELLVPAYRTGDQRLMKTYYGLLRTYPNLTWIAPEVDLAAMAARLRADYRLKTPDAIQAATAVHARTSAFITNDPVFQRVTELDVLVLGELL